MRKIILFLLVAYISVVGSREGAEATEYYVANNGSDLNPCTSKYSPCKTIQGAIGKMSGGDSLTIGDGTYTGTSNMIHSIPSGSPSGYTIISAENDGEAILSGQTQSVTIDGVDYFQLEGIRIKNGTASHAVVITDSEYIKVFRVTIKNGINLAARYGNVFEVTDGARYVLVEDCSISGAMRYGFVSYGGNEESRYILFRRCVTRFDGNTEREPKAGFAAYGAASGIVGTRDVLFQNCIGLDYLGDTDGAAMIGAFGNPHSPENIYFQGCISLNNKAAGANGMFLGENARYVAAEHSVAWDNKETGIAVRDGGPYSISQCTSSMNDNSNYGVWGNANISLSNNLFTDSHGLQHITRANSVDGATIEKQYGVSGTLWGEPGYNQLTSDDLWPFPYQDRIKHEFAEDDSIPGNNASRGFCAEGIGLYGGNITLTSYIWEYLGNPCPPEICDYAPPYHQADTNQDSVINMPELIAFIARWKTGDGVTKQEVEGARNIWFSGGVY